jgi:hypothetical protein
MTKHIRALSLIFLVLPVLACTLPGAAPPTAFNFPLPNLTMTSIFGTALVDPATPPTIPPIQVTSVTASPTSVVEAGATDTPVLAPTHTPTPVPATATNTPVAAAVPTARPNGAPVSAIRLTTAPTIDAILNEWSGNAFNSNHVVHGGASWAGTSDLSAICYAGWDTTNLYFALRVFDDTHAQISTGVYLYRGDSVELQFDRDLVGDFYVRTQSSDDTQIGFSPGNFDGLSPEAYRWFPNSLSGPLSSVIVDSRQTPQGYEIEIKIPWATLGITPTAGSYYGFALSVSDNDQVGSAVQESMVSSVSSREWGDPTTWGTLYLAP